MLLNRNATCTFCAISYYLQSTLLVYATCELQCLRLFQIPQIQTEENASDRENQVHDGNQQSSFAQRDKEPKIRMSVIRLASAITRHKRLLIVFLSSGVLVTLILLGGYLKIWPTRDKVRYI